MDNFNLRKYLIENKLTTQSKLISEEFLFVNTDGKMVYVTIMKVNEREISAPNVGAPRMITPGSFIVAAFDMKGKKMRTKRG